MSGKDDENEENEEGPATEEIPSHEARALSLRASEPPLSPEPDTEDVEPDGPAVLPDLEEDPPTQRMDSRQLPLPSRYRLLGTGRIEGPIETLDVLDTELDRMVVLCRWRGDVRRFRRWSRQRAQLEVAGIPPVYDTGTLPDGARYVTVQAMHGQTLEEARLDDAQFVRCWVEACRIVAWAHGRGVVHGDLIPARLRIDARQQVQIAGWLGSTTRSSVDLEALRKLFRARFPQAPELSASSANGLADAGQGWFSRRGTTG